MSRSRSIAISPSHINGRMDLEHVTVHGEIDANLSKERSEDESDLFFCS